MQRGYQFKDHKYSARFWRNGRWHYVYDLNSSTSINVGGRNYNITGGLRDLKDKARDAYDNARYEARYRLNNSRRYLEDAPDRAREAAANARNTIRERTGLAARDRYRSAEREYRRQQEQLRDTHRVIRRSGMPATSIARNVVNRQISESNEARRTRNSARNNYQKTYAYKVEQRINTGRNIVDSWLKKKRR